MFDLILIFLTYRKKDFVTDKFAHEASQCMYDWYIKSFHSGAFHNLSELFLSGFWWVVYWVGVCFQV